LVSVPPPLSVRFLQLGIYLVLTKGSDEKMDVAGEYITLSEFFNQDLAKNAVYLLMLNLELLRDPPTGSKAPGHALKPPCCQE